MFSSKKSRMFVGLLASATLLAACGSSDDNSKDSSKKELSVELGKAGEFPISEETINMTMMGPNVGMAEWKDMPVFQEMEKKTNIHFDFNTPPMADFGTKLNLAFASEDLPDVLLGAGQDNLTPAMEIDYGKQGILVPLEDLIDENMPNFKKILDEDPDIRKSITTPDGHIYSLPAVSRGDSAIWPRGPMWYKGEWLKALDVKELPKTTDEFYDLLVRMRDEDPNGNGKKDEIPLLDVKMESTRPWLMAAFGITVQDVEDMDGEVVYTPVTENYKEYLTFMHKLYDEKLLDQETFSQADEQKKAKGQNDQLGLFPDWFSYFTTGEDEEGALQDPMFQPLTSDISPEAVVPGSPRMSRTTFSITKTCPSPEAALRWVDYFYGGDGAEEGPDFLNKGPEGSFWQYTEDKDGNKVRIYGDDVDTSKTEDERAKVTPAYGVPMPTIDYPASDETSIRIDADTPPDMTFNDFIKSETEAKITPYAKVPFPLLYLTSDESDSVRDSATDLKTYVEQMEAKFITGVEPLDNWDKYVKTIEGMGLDNYVKTYQQAYDRWAEE